MQISPEQISHFQLIYKTVFGENISEQEAHEKGMNLVRLVQLTYKPMRKEEFARVGKEIIKIQHRINKRNKI